MGSCDKEQGESPGNGYAHLQIRSALNNGATKINCLRQVAWQGQQLFSISKGFMLDVENRV